MMPHSDSNPLRGLGPAVVGVGVLSRGAAPRVSTTADVGRRFSASNKPPVVNDRRLS
jgi:hypothetical protein